MSAYLRQQSEEEFDFPLMVKIYKWKEFRLEGDDDDDYVDDEGDGEDLGKQLLERQQKELEALEKKLADLRESEDTYSEDYRPYSEPDLSRHYFGGSSTSVYHKTAKKDLEYFETADIELYDVVECLRLGNEAVKYRKGQRKALYEVGIVVGTPPDTFDDAKGDLSSLSSLSSSLHKNVYAVRFSSSNELEEFVPKHRIRKFRIEAMSLSNLGTMGGLHGGIIGPSAKLDGAKAQMMVDKFKKDFGQMMTSPAVFIRRPPETSVSGKKSGTFSRWVDNGRLLTFQADTKYFRYGTKANRKLELDFAPSYVPIIPLGAFLAVAEYKDKHANWKFSAPMRCKNLNIRVDEELQNFEAEINIRLIAYKTQLEEFSAEESQFGKTIANVWAEASTAAKARLQFSTKGAKSLPIVTADPKFSNGSSNGPMPLQSVSHINGLSIAYDVVLKMDDLKAQLNNPKKSLLSTPRDDSTVVLDGPEYHLWTVHRHTTQKLELDVGFAPATEGKKKKAVTGLAGVQVFVHNGFVRVSNVVPGGPASKLNLGVYDIISGVDMYDLPDDLWWDGIAVAGGKKPAALQKEFMEKQGAFNITVHSNRFELLVSPKEKIVKLSKSELRKLREEKEAKAAQLDDDSEGESSDDEADEDTDAIREDQKRIMTLGFTVSSTKQRCVVVETVDLEGGAYDAGLQVGDCLTHLDGWPLRGSSDIEIQPLLLSANSLTLSVSRPTGEHPYGTSNSVRPLAAQKDGSIRSLRLDIRRTVHLAEIERLGNGVPKKYEGWSTAAVEGGADYNAAFQEAFSGNRETTPLLDALQDKDLKSRKVDLKKAALSAVMDIINDLTETAPGMLNEANIGGVTALSLAAKLGLDDVISKLISVDILDLNAPDTSGCVPILHAVKAGSSQAVKLLLEAGCNPNITSIAKQHPLTSAMETSKPNMSIARYLVHSGLLNINLDLGPDDPGDIVHRVLKFHKKAPQKALACIDLLVAYGVNLNIKDKQGKTTLARAIEWYDSTPEIAARIVLNDSPVATPLDLSVAEEVYNKGKKKATTPLIFLVGQKQTHAVGKLVGMGVSGQHVRYEIPEKLLSKKSKYSQPCTPFELSVFIGAGGCASIFVAEDPQVYAAQMQMPPGYIFGVGFDANGWKLAPEQGDPSSASKYARNEELCISALMKATNKDALEWVELFKEHKFDFDRKRSYGVNLTNALAALGHTEACLNVLKDTEMNIALDVLDDRNRSLLFYASYSKRDDRSNVLTYLLENGADPEVADSDRVTPLLAAARNNDLNTLIALRNIDFDPVAPERTVDPLSPRPVGKAKVIVSAVDPEGICVYKEPSSTSAVLCWIKGTVPDRSKQSFCDGGARRGSVEKRRGSLEKLGSLLKDPTKKAAAFVEKVKKAMDYEISGTVTVHVTQATTGSVTVMLESATDLAPQLDAEDKETSCPQCEICLASDISRKKTSTTKANEEPTCDPEWNEELMVEPSAMKKSASLSGSIKFSAEHDSEGGRVGELKVRLNSCGIIASAASAYVVVSLVYKSGDKHPEHSFVTETQKKATNFTFDDEEAIFDIDAEDLQTMDVLVELFTTSDELVGVCNMAATDAIATDAEHDVPFMTEIWGYQVMVIEVWSGKRGGKSSKFLGQARINVGAAIANDGKIEGLKLKAIDDQDTWGANKSSGLLEYYDIAVSEQKDENWFRVHQSTYYDLTEVQGASPFNPYTEGWIKVKGEVTKRNYIQYEEGEFKPKPFPGKAKVYTPFEAYKKNPKYKGVQGEELNRRDNFGNTVLYYAVLHESVDMIQNLLRDPQIDVNAVCAEGMTPFMMSVLIKPRGNLPIFFSFIDLAGDRIDWQQVEDKSKKTDPKTNIDGKANNLADYALLQEFCHAERPMLNVIQQNECDPTGLVATLLEYEALMEQDRMQSYILPEVVETNTVVKEEENLAKGITENVTAKEETTLQKEVKGSVTYSMSFNPAGFDGYGELQVKVVKAQGLEVHEMSEKVKKKKNKETGVDDIEIKTTRWCNPFVDVVLLHEDQAGRRDAVKRKTKTVSKVVDGKLASFVKVNNFELNKEECTKKAISLEVWHKAGAFSADVFLGRFKASVEEGLASDGKLLTADLEEVEDIPPPVERKSDEGEDEDNAEDQTERGGGGDGGEDKPENDTDDEDDGNDEAGDGGEKDETEKAKGKGKGKGKGNGKPKKKKSFIQRMKDKLKEDNIVPAWTNTLQSDGIIKRAWLEILKEEARPWDSKLVAKLRCTYDPDEISEEISSEISRQTIEKAKKAAEVAAVLAAAGAGTMVGMGSSAALTMKFILGKARKYAESLIGKQDKEHNYFAPLFKASTAYYHISRESWMNRKYYPVDHGTEDYTYKRELLTSNVVEGADDLVNLKKEVFLFERNAKDVKQIDATEERDYDPKWSGVGGAMFDALVDASDLVIKEEDNDDDDDEGDGDGPLDAESDEKDGGGESASGDGDGNDGSAAANANEDADNDGANPL